MPTLLHLDASPLGEASVSRHLTSEFVKNWKKANPEGKVITRDLTTSGLTSLTAPLIGAFFTPKESRTPEQNQLLVLSDSLVAEIKEADEYAIGAPMHNFGVPSVLKQWIDLIARAGETFAYIDGAPKGLLQGKKAHFLLATGGVYGAGSAMESFNFVEPYLRTVFGFLGVTDTSFQTAGGAASLNYGADREAFLLPHVEAIRARFAVN
ncbi:FMN-dependent NADH-azoreductase [Granulicella mallensis]|uniref:FMN dependent NADH:quinone oxidoreductase n=1 Tax=Granulicella mallensis TaxID=940614 RepID=A0A7W7ZQ21_9BACT|nr:NAD(P)H-dependent oxidoreductase [Granulicella mallensis]MBB5064045.1 FMN-dependent NADH-azoreductase [Granulicella mallensis]